MTNRRAVDPDQLVALEEERDFLLRSLDDLDRERDAGDVADDDYATLKDGYTVRAAHVMRAIADQRASMTVPRRPVRWGGVVLGVLSAVAIAVAITVALVNATAERRGATSPTGGVPGSVADLDPRIFQAQDRMQVAPLDAIKLLDQVIKDPAASKADVVEAKSYYGWTLYFTARGLDDEASKQLLADRAIQQLESALADDPQTGGAPCFLAVVKLRLKADTGGARTAFDQCVAGSPPPEVTPLLGAFEVDLQAAEAGH